MSEKTSTEVSEAAQKDYFYHKQRALEELFDSGETTRGFYDEVSKILGTMSLNQTGDHETWPSADQFVSHDSRKFFAENEAALYELAVEVALDNGVELDIDYPLHDPNPQLPQAG